jgi:hypothetical protein
MNAIRATWTNGQILPNEPVTWPEGTELFIEPARQQSPLLARDLNAFLLSLPPLGDDADQFAKDIRDIQAGK